MTFPNYHIYIQMVTSRDHIVFGLAIIVLIAFGVLSLVQRFNAAWLKPAAWIIGVGGFYATLAPWIVYILTLPARPYAGQ